MIKLNNFVTKTYLSGEHFKFQNALAGYPRNLIEKVLSEINFTERSLGLILNRKIKIADILPYVKKYEHSVPNIKQVLLGKYHMLQNQPLLTEIFKDPSIISFRKGKSLKDMLVGAKRVLNCFTLVEIVPARHHLPLITAKIKEH